MTSIPNEHPSQDFPPDPAAGQADPAGSAPLLEVEAADSSGTLAGETSLADDAMTLLSEHKGKLAIGVAATLGLMVYYGWREKRLPQTDPEEYARLQRLRANLRHSDEARRTRHARKTATQQADAASQPNDPAGAALPSGATQDTDPASDKS